MNECVHFRAITKTAKMRDDRLDGRSSLQQPLFFSFYFDEFSLTHQSNTLKYCGAYSHLHVIKQKKKDRSKFVIIHNCFINFVLKLLSQDSIKSYKIRSMRECFSMTSFLLLHFRRSQKKQKKNGEVNSCRGLRQKTLKFRED